MVARNAQSHHHHHPRPLPPSRIASRARFRFPFSLPFSSACHAGYVNLVCDIISCFVNILSVASKPTHFFSHSHVVTGKVENILRHSVMLGYIVWLISFKVADAVVGTVLGSCRDSTCTLLLLKMYTYLFFYSENSDRFP